MEGREGKETCSLGSGVFDVRRCGCSLDVVDRSTYGLAANLCRPDGLLRAPGSSVGGGFHRSLCRRSALAMWS